MAFQFWIGDALTGRRLAYVQPYKWSFTRRLGSSGIASASFTGQSARDLSPAVWEDYTRYWARTLTIAWEGTPVCHGYITGKEDSENGEVLTIHTEDLWAVLELRCLFPLSRNQDITFSGMSMKGQIAQMLDYAVGGYWKLDRWGMPVTTPSAGRAGSEPDMTVKWVNFEKSANLIREVMGRNGGPEVDFDPVRASGSDVVSWNAVVESSINRGSVKLGVNANVPHAVADIRGSGGKQVTGLFLLGKGYDEAMVWGAYNESSDGVAAKWPDLPFLDTVVTMKDVDQGIVLMRHGMALISANRGGTESLTVEVPAENVPPTRLLPGTMAEVAVSRSTFRTEGRRSGRIVEMSYSDGELGKVTIQ